MLDPLPGAAARAGRRDGRRRAAQLQHEVLVLVETGLEAHRRAQAKAERAFLDELVETFDAVLIDEGA